MFGEHLEILCINTMINYNINNKSTILNIKSYEDLSSDFGNLLPYPQKHYINHLTKLRGFINVYTYSWVLEGFFNTKKNVNFLNDIVARMMITFPNAKIEKVSQIEIKNNEEQLNSLKLKHFQNLKSIQSRIYNYEKVQKIQCEDQTFWALKLYFEQMIKNDNLSYQHLLDFAIHNFSDKSKDRSTLKAKCRNIYNYYAHRDFKIFCEYKRKLNDKELSMTRSKNMKKVNDLQSRENRTLVVNAITGLYQNEYKTKKGEWNISKLSKALNLSRNTIYKYLLEFQQKF